MASNYNTNTRRVIEKTFTIRTYNRWGTLSNSEYSDRRSFAHLEKSGGGYSNYNAFVKTGQVIQPQALYYTNEVYDGWSGFIYKKYHEWVWYNEPPRLTLGEDLIGSLDVNGGLPEVYRPVPSPFRCSQAEAKSVQKLLSKVKDMKVNTAQAVAEMHQTARMFESTAYRFADFIALLQQKRLRQACRILGTSPSRGLRRRFGRDWGDSPSAAVANAYLELSFGWKPLIEDLVGFANQMGKVLNTVMPPPNSSRVNPAADSVTKVDIIEQSFNRFVTLTETTSVQVAVGVKFDLLDVARDAARSLGLTNPLELGWQLQPFSFMIDWACGIGDVLTNLDASFGLRFVSGWQRTTIKGDLIGSMNQSYLQTYEWSYVGSAAARRSFVNVHREVLHDFPSSYVPVLSNPLSIRHIALSIALLRQRV